MFPVVFFRTLHQVFVLLFFLWLALATEAQTGRAPRYFSAFPAQESFLFRLSASPFTAFDLLRRIHALPADSPAPERRRKKSIHGTADAAPSFRVVSELKKHSSPQKLCLAVAEFATTRHLKNSTEPAGFGVPAGTLQCLFRVFRQCQAV